MRASNWKFLTAAAAVMLLAACKTPQETNTAAGAEGASGTTTASGTGTSVPTLVNVSLQNVLNDLAVKLNVSQANIPVNAQVPIDVAANVCGVSVNVLAASVASGNTASCTATTASPQLVQVVQQQVSAGGNVGGGAQTMGGSTTNNMF